MDGVGRDSVVAVGDWRLVPIADDLPERGLQCIHIGHLLRRVWYGGDAEHARMACRVLHFRSGGGRSAAVSTGSYHGIVRSCHVCRAAWLGVPVLAPRRMQKGHRSPITSAAIFRTTTAVRGVPYLEVRLGRHARWSKSCSPRTSIVPLIGPMYFRIALLLPAVLSIPSLNGQTTISGLVLAEGSNETLVGANLHWSGTTIGTTAGFDGAFTIQLPPRWPARLVTSFVGVQDRYASAEGTAQGALEDTASLGRGHGAG